VSVIGAIVGARGEIFKPDSMDYFLTSVLPSRRFVIKRTSRSTFLVVILEATSLYLVQMVMQPSMSAGPLVPSLVLKLRMRRTSQR
jgi:hypothetical protein